MKKQNAMATQRQAISSANKTAARMRARNAKKLRKLKKVTSNICSWKRIS